MKFGQLILRKTVAARPVGSTPGCWNLDLAKGNNSRARRDPSCRRAAKPPIGRAPSKTSKRCSTVATLHATRCHNLMLKCTKFDFGWGSAPDPAGGAYSAPPAPLAGLKGSYF